MDEPRPHAARELFGSTRQAVAVLIELGAWVVAVSLLALDVALVAFIEPGGWWDRFAGIPVIVALVAVAAIQWWSHATGNRRASMNRVARAEGATWPRIPRFWALAAARYLDLPAGAARRGVSLAEFVLLASSTTAIGIGGYQIWLLLIG